MENTITLKLEADPALISAIDRLTNAVYGLSPLPSATKTPAPVPAQAQLVNSAPLSAAPVPTASAPAYTLQQLAAAASTLMDAGKQPELISLLGKYGIPSMQQLKQDKFAEFAADLRSLGAKV